MRDLTIRLVLPLLLVCQGLLIAGETGAEEWREDLKQVRSRVVDAVNRTDRYICVQDLSRFYYAVPTPAMACRQPPIIPAAPLWAEDRLKLDVAVSEGSEIYSWHGEHKFSARTVGQVVHDGPIASGSFNGYLRNIFGEPGVHFSYAGRTNVDDLELDRFDYEVPLEASHYQIQNGKGLQLIGFHGSFAARTDNFEMYSLVVTANGDAISKKSNLCAVETRLTYQLVHISDHDLLLPKSFELMMGQRDMAFTESRGVFSECREYRGESTVRFDSDDETAKSVVPTVADEEPLRPGLLFQIALKGSIDEDSAYAGEPVEATLVRNVKISKGRILSKGATLHGTVTGFRVYEMPHHVTLNLEFNSIVDGKNLYLCRAIHDGIITDRQGLLQEDQTEGAMVFNTSHLHLDHDFTSLFMTVSQVDTESK